MKVTHEGKKHTLEGLKDGKLYLKEVETGKIKTLDIEDNAERDNLSDLTI